MKNRRFDELARRSIEAEDIKMRGTSEARLEAMLREPVLREEPRRMPMRSVVLVVALILALLGGVALAAISWNSREYLTYTNDAGEAVVNETLLAHVQPVERAFAGDALAIDIIDAMFDGNALVMTWTTENKGAESIYLLCDMKINGDWPGMGSRTRVDELFLAPGETIESGMTMRTDEMTTEQTDTCAVEMVFTALTYSGEVVDLPEWSYLGDQDEDTNKRRDEWIDAQVAQGNLVLAPDGVIELGSSWPYEEGMTRADVLEASGLMAKADVVDASFTVERNAQVQSALPDGKPIEKDNGGYTLRVLRADLTPGSATFELERVFDSREAAEAYSAYYTKKLGPYWGFSFQDETGDIWWNGNGGGSSDTEAPVEQADGTWVWNYRALMTDLYRLPKSITIIPERDDLEGKEFNIPYPDEAITVYFEENNTK